MTADLLAGRYRRHGVIGRGAMGEVWRAHDELLDRPVAIKQLRLDVTDAAALPRIVREARVAARLQHPNLVAVHDLVTVDDVPYVVMELVEGESLADRIRSAGPLSVAAAMTMLRQLATALGVAHEHGVVHRDIKPANVLLGRREAAKLADFGIARSQGDAALTETGHMIGTVAFMPPEIAHGGDATPASDIWSLGATMYAAVEGRAPFGGSGTTAATLLRLVSQDVPAPTRAGDLTDVLLAMLDRDAARRPSAAGVVALLDGVAVEGATVRRKPALAPAPDTGPVALVAAPRPAGSRPAMRLVGIAAGAVVLGGAAAAIALSSSGSGPTVAPAPTNVARPAPLTRERTVVATATVTAAAPTPAVSVVTETPPAVTQPAPAVTGQPSVDALQSRPHGAIVIYTSVAETRNDPVGTVRATVLRLRDSGIEAYYVLTDGVTNLRTGYYVAYSREPALPSKARLAELRGSRECATPTPSAAA